MKNDAINLYFLILFISLVYQMYVKLKRSPILMIGIKFKLVIKFTGHSN